MTQIDVNTQYLCGSEVLKEIKSSILFTPEMFIFRGFFMIYYVKIKGFF